MSAEKIADELFALDTHKSHTVIVTGGEPALQWDEELAAALRARGFRIHMETNGTRQLGAAVDWLTVSPKPQFHEGRFALDPSIEPSECKIVVDDSVERPLLEELRRRYPRCQHWFLQPCDSDRREQHLQKTLAMLHELDGFRLSVQLHKILGLP